MIITKRVTMDARVRLAHASALQVALVTLFMLFTAGAGAQETWETRRAKLGSKEEPYRILVDKVLMASNEWVMTPEHVAEIKAAGFNVVVPRTGADENERVERVARMAMEQGLFYMPWIRGTRVETGDPKLRATDELGRTGSLASPNADALWDYWRDRILFYARLSREVPSVLGVFLDFENYDRVKIGGGMCYTLSYDEPILRQFAQARGLSLPDPLPANRAEWLEKQGQTKAFEEFQVGRWRERARKLRQEVDALNPRFQFVVYPATHSLFIREVVWREWHTKQAPLIMAEVDTYWRHEYDLADALERLRQIMIKAREALDQVDPAIRYMAGLDPIVSGANPEFEGKSAVLGAEFGHGYWVFYEGPDYHKDHPEYFRWFKRANDHIARRDYSLWRQPAETPNPFDAAVEGKARAVAGAKLVPFNATDPVPQDALERGFIHRTEATYQVLLKQGERLHGQPVQLLVLEEVGRDPGETPQRHLGLRVVASYRRHRQLQGRPPQLAAGPRRLSRLDREVQRHRAVLGQRRRHPRTYRLHVGEGVVVVGAGAQGRVGQILGQAQQLGDLLAARSGDGVLKPLPEVHALPPFPPDQTSSGAPNPPRSGSSHSDRVYGYPGRYRG